MLSNRAPDRPDQVVFTFSGGDWVAEWSGTKSGLKLGRVKPSAEQFVSICVPFHLCLELV
jgi:hypothetical protein